MLTVWSLCWGDKYTDYHVQRLQREVRERLTFPHRFICITDRDIEGVACIPPINDLPGWWGKVNLFNPEVTQPHSVNIWFDLDVVFTGYLDYLATYSPPLAMPLNWAQSGHGGCQSSVMVWTPTEQTERIYRQFNHDWAHWPPRNERGVFWGDQEWITYLRDTGHVDVEALPYVCSYKYHCRVRPPHDARIVVFHGDPKPEVVEASWFQW